MNITSHQTQPEGIIYEMLANRRRRMVIEYVQEQPPGSPVSLQDLSREIAAMETGKPIADVDYDDRKSAYTALRQTHLPKLDEAGLVTFDEDRLTVAATEATQNVSVYMEVVPDSELSWSNYYILLSLLGSALLAANVMNIFPFNLVTAPYLTAVLLVLFMLSAVGQRIELTRRRFSWPKSDAAGDSE